MRDGKDSGLDATLAPEVTGETMPVGRLGEARAAARADDEDLAEARAAVDATMVSGGGGAVDATMVSGAGGAAESSNAGTSSGGGRVIRPAAERLAATVPDYPELATVSTEHYVIGEQIAEGGMGQIRAARDRRLGRPVAVKSLRGQGKSSDLASRFEHEARITARLQHPAIVTIHEAGRWPDGDPFFAMKLVEGRSLDDAIGDCKSLADRLALLANVVTVAEAIAYAHEHRVIHRDIKPKNVLVGAFGETVVIDWGLAKDLADASDPDLGAGPYRDHGNGATIVGDVLGTPAYMPVEQARGEAVDERADVYSIGALLYHLLAGTPPYSGANAHEVIEALKRGAPKPIADVQPGLPPDLVAIVERAMARDPEDRYPSANPLAIDLRKFTNGQLVGAHAYSAWQLLRRWIRRHRGVVIATILALVALGAFGAYSFRRIVRERDEADHQRRLTSERDEKLAVEHAREIVADDPTMAVAALGKLAPTSPYWREVRTLVVDAQLRGIATRVAEAFDHAADRIIVAPDGRTIAGGPNGEVAIWRADGSRDVVLRGHRGAIIDLAVSADGATIASVAVDGTAMVWRDGKGRPLAPNELVTRVAGVASTGDIVATTRDAVLACPAAGGACRKLAPKIPIATRGVIRTYLDGNGRQVATRKTETWADRLDGFVVSPAQPLVMTCGDRRTTIWDLGKPDAPERYSNTDRVRGCAFLADGRAIIVRGNKLAILGPDLVERVVELADDSAATVTIATSGDLVALASDSISVFRLDGTRVGTVEIERSISRVAFLPDAEHRLVFATTEGIGLVDLVPTTTGTFPRPTWLPNASSLALANDAFVTSYTDGSIRWWSFAVRRNAAGIVDEFGAASLAISADGATYALDSLGKVRLRDKKSQRAELKLDEECKDLALAPDGSAVKATCAKQTKLLGATGESTLADTSAAWLSTGELLGWSWNQPKLVVRDHVGVEKRTIDLGGGIEHLRVARGADIAVTIIPGSLAFIDIATGKQLRTIEKPPCTIEARVALAWDGRTFACADDRTIWIARVAGEPTELRGHVGEVDALAFLSDGTLASTSRDATLRLWTMDGSVRTLPLQRQNDDQITRIVTGPNATLVTLGKRARIWEPSSGTSRELAGDVVDAQPLDEHTLLEIGNLRVDQIVDTVPRDAAALATMVHAATTVIE